MDLKEYQIKTVEALILNSETLGDLYKLYADKFPAHKNFWLDLFTEATNQANSIYKLQGKVKDGSVYFNVDRFKIETIQNFFGYIRDKIVEIKNKEITMLEALSAALNFEDSILEKNFFDIFEVDLVELKHFFADLADATKKRRDKIEKLLEAERSLGDKPS